MFQIYEGYFRYQLIREVSNKVVWEGQVYFGLNSYLVFIVLSLILGSGGILVSRFLFQQNLCYIFEIYIIWQIEDEYVGMEGQENDRREQGISSQRVW